MSCKVNCAAITGYKRMDKNRGNYLFQSCTTLILGTDPKVQRMVRYSLGVLLIFVFCTTMLWFELPHPEEQHAYAVAMTVFVIGGAAVFCVLTRTSRRLGLSSAQLAIWQGYHAIVCIMGGYPIAPSVRGALLILLIVVVVFCSFSLGRNDARKLAAFGITVMGAVMLYLAATDPATFVPAYELVHFSIASSMLVVVSFLAGQLNYLRNKVALQKQDLQKALERIQIMAAHDELTSLPNRRHMSEVLAAEERRHRMTNARSCVALLDIDFFKRINDTHGHIVGDEVLKGFSTHFKQCLRSTDVLARWGGEEFLFLMTDTDLETAATVLKRIQAQITALYIDTLKTHLPVTFSAGVTELGYHQSMNEAIGKADYAMYQAKAAGRNKVCAVEA